MAKKRRGLNIALRYLLLIIVSLPGLTIFYIVFTPLTAYPVYWLLSLVYDAALMSGNIILINNFFPIELIEACIAGSAYYLLLILNLATPGIRLDKRIKAIIFSFLVFLLVNIIRIVLLSSMAVSGSPIFDATHKIFWYLVSTVFVVGIWFAEVKLFRIKEIPFWSDFKFLFKKSNLNLKR